MIEYVLIKAFEAFLALTLVFAICMTLSGAVMVLREVYKDWKRRNHE